MLISKNAEIIEMVPFLRGSGKQKARLEKVYEPDLIAKCILSWQVKYMALAIKNKKKMHLVEVTYFRY